VHKRLEVNEYLVNANLYPDIQGAVSADHLSQLAFSDPWFGLHAFSLGLTLYIYTCIHVYYICVCVGATACFRVKD